MNHRPHRLAAIICLACAGLGQPAAALDAPALRARVKPILSAADGTRFKDLNNNGRLDPYEDWRQLVARRVADLVARMTLEEKAGLMLIDTLNAGCEGAASPKAFDFVNRQHMHRFILRNVVTASPSCGPDRGFRAGSSVTPEQAAQFTNSLQEMSEATRLGIPALFKSNARNHYEKDARAGINEAAGAFTEFPKEAGLAAAALGSGGMAPIKSFARVMGEEWQAIGLRGMYGYMADLATEPRWYRVHETFTEDADLAADILRTLVQDLQGGPLHPGSPVALTLKHFPGGGPQEQGLDPHYAHGKNQVYPAGNFGYHLKPFQAAIDAGVAAVMPYYGVPIDVTYRGVRYAPIGMAFSGQIVTDLLRGQLGFKGYVNSDTGIINDRAWGLEGKSVSERVAAAINGGTDTLSGFNRNQTLTELVRAGLVSEARVTEAAARLLRPLFELGLFENPYVDEAQAAHVLGSEAHRAAGLDVQRQSIVLLQNKPLPNAGKTLPLPADARLYVMGLAGSDAAPYVRSVTHGETTAQGAPLSRNAAGDVIGRPSAAGHDRALIRIEVRNVNTGAFKSDDPATGMNPAHPNPRTGKPWGAEDRCVALGQKPCTDDGLIFGGPLPWEADSLSFSAMAASQQQQGSWQISPSLADIQAVMREIGPERTVLAIYFRQPYVLDEASGLRQAGAIVAGFGVSNTALLDVLSGKVRATGTPIAPQGKLPFALANNLQAVIDNQPDAPGYPPSDTLFPFGFGLTY